jgi:hypothetical protein
MKVTLWLRVLDAPQLGREKMLHRTIEWPDGYRIPVVDEHVPLLWNCDPNEGDASSEVTRVAWSRGYEPPYDLQPHLEFGLHHTDGAGTDTHTPYIERPLLDQMAADGWEGWP